MRCCGKTKTSKSTSKLLTASHVSVYVHVSVYLHVHVSVYLHVHVSVYAHVYLHVRVTYFLLVRDSSCIISKLQVALPCSRLCTSAEGLYMDKDCLLETPTCNLEELEDMPATKSI